MKTLRRILNRQGAAAWLATIILCWTCGCTTTPITGRRRFLVTSMSQETTLGAKAWGDLQKEQPLSTNKAEAEAVVRVGTAISKVVNAPGFKWEFKLFASDEANAFCLPGGKVGVYEGLFKHISNDAELAAVLGHEIAHATLRHGGERMSQAMAVGLVGLGLSVALNSKDVENRELWMAAYAGLTTVGVVLPYSRQHEYEADQVGILYMAKAGYDPEAAVTFWQKFSKGKSSSQTLEFLSTHPLDANRIRRLQAIMPRAMLDYKQAPVKHGLGTVYSSSSSESKEKKK